MPDQFSPDDYAGQVEETQVDAEAPTQAMISPASPGQTQEEVDPNAPTQAVQEQEEMIQETQIDPEAPTQVVVDHTDEAQIDPEAPTQVVSTEEDAPTHIVEHTDAPASPEHGDGNAVPEEKKDDGKEQVEAGRRSRSRSKSRSRSRSSAASSRSRSGSRGSHRSPTIWSF